MTVHVGNAIVNAGTRKPWVYARELRRAYVRWYHEDQSGRAPGGSCMTSVRALNNPLNRHWVRVVTLSKGCGANMRVAPVAFAQRDQISGLAQLSAAMTHGHPTAIAAAELTAWAVRMSAEGMNGSDLLDWLIRYAISRCKEGDASYEGLWLNELRARRWGGRNPLTMAQGWSDNIKMLERAWSKLQRPDNGFSDACEGIGQAWNADEALGVAMYVVARHWRDPHYALARGARTGGDSDSIACITGAIVGAYHGIDQWNRAWVQKVEFSRELDDMAFNMYLLGEW